MKEENIYNYCHIAGRTDIGCKRQANEDSMGNFETINGLAAVVCDGMGGHVGGATASRLAVEAIHGFLDGQYYEDPREAIGEAIDAANKAILHQAMIQPELQGMGSTCVLLLVRDSKVYIGHVGDSRVYLIRNRCIKQLTKDHSYVQMLVDMGQLTNEQAEHHPRKNEITNALGIANMKPATVLPDAILPEAGDCFLLCSDGLSGMISDREIERIVSRQSEMGSQERVDYLVQRARDNGGLDNITVEIVEFSITPGSPSKPQRRKIGMIILTVILLICIGASGGYYFWNKHFKSESITIYKSFMRRDTIIMLPEIKFQKGEDILEINYKQGHTEILMGKEKEKVIEINRALSSDSLKYDEDIDVAYGNRLLVFRQEFKNEQLRFSLADSVKIFKFVVPVVKDMTLTQPKQTHQESTPSVVNDVSNTANGSIVAIVAATGKVDSLTYRVDAQFVPKRKAFSFIEGENACFLVEGQSQPSKLNRHFQITDIEYDATYFKKTKKETGFDISFTEKEPSKKIDIVIKGKEKEGENSTDVLLNIIISLNINKEGK